jgi:hypothetical protein
MTTCVPKETREATWGSEECGTCGCRLTASEQARCQGKSFRLCLPCMNHMYVEIHMRAIGK